jgi:hypothetical protein
LNCDRWSTLPVVLQMRRQAKPRMHRLLPNRVAGRRESRDIESAHHDPADRRVAVPFPIECGAAIRAEMKSNAIAAVGIALVNLPLTVKPHPLFRDNWHRNGKRCRCGASMPCSGTDTPDRVHLWQSREASRSGNSRLVPSISSHFGALCQFRRFSRLPSSW